MIGRKPADTDALFRAPSAGLVQSRSGVCLRRVLRSLRRPWLPSTFVLPERSAGEGGERRHD